MIEVEFKFKAEHSSVEQLLIEIGAEFIKDEYNLDQYYNHPAKNYIETDEVLRLRKLNDEFEITYKGPKINAQSKSRVEQNITIQNYEEFELLFDNLGFVKSGYVEKKRRKYNYDDITITLDNVKGLGEYAEFEIDIEDEYKMEVAIKKIKKLITRLGLDVEDQIMNSYLYLLENS